MRLRRRRRASSRAIRARSCSFTFSQMRGELALALAWAMSSSRALVIVTLGHEAFQMRRRSCAGGGGRSRMFTHLIMPLCAARIRPSQLTGGSFSPERLLCADRCVESGFWRRRKNASDRFPHRRMDSRSSMLPRSRWRAVAAGLCRHHLEDHAGRLVHDAPGQPALCSSSCCRPAPPCGGPPRPALALDAGTRRGRLRFIHVIVGAGAHRSTARSSPTLPETRMNGISYRRHARSSRFQGRRKPHV